jgi:hypothetical protein
MYMFCGATIFIKTNAITQDYMERSIEFVIKVGAETEAVGLFKSIHLFVYKLGNVTKCYRWCQTKGLFVLRTKW